MIVAKKRWTTWWSASQRGMNVNPQAYCSTQKIQLTLPKCSMFKLRFSNFYDDTTLCIKQAFYQLAYETCRHPITFEDANDIRIVPQGSVFTDPIVHEFQEHETITLYYEIESSGTCASGIRIHDDVVNAENNVVYALHAIHVYSDEYKGCICIFGDSIVEQANYTRVLKQKFASHKYAVLNEGISGNRLLRKLTNVQYLGQVFSSLSLDKQCFGIAGEKRFERDVCLGKENLEYVVIAIGINDLYQPGSWCANRSELPTFEELQAGFIRIFALLTQYEIPYTVCAITPFLEAGCKNEYKEELRIRINTWLSAYVPSFVHFDHKLMNSDHTLLEQYHDGDGLHPNCAGGKIMAECIYNEMRKYI